MSKKIATIDSSNFKSRFLPIKYGTSTAAGSYGYNRVVLVDTMSGAKAAATGGGYDMTGTVVGEWMMAHIQDRLDKLEPGTKSVGFYPRPLYGIQYKGTTSGSGYTYAHAHVDGGCGLSSMLDIARACGIIIEEVYDRSARNVKCIGFDVREVAA